MGTNPWSGAEWQASASLETWLQIINAKACFESVLDYLGFCLGAKDKADLPLHSERVEDVSRLGQWMLKNPSEKGARKRKRTPLTVPRKHSLRREGVKTTPPA